MVYVLVCSNLDSLTSCCVTGRLDCQQNHSILVGNVASPHLLDDLIDSFATCTPLIKVRHAREVYHRKINLVCPVDSQVNGYVHDRQILLLCDLVTDPFNLMLNLR